MAEWAVWTAGRVVVCADGAEAFLRERLLREDGRRAVVVVRWGGRGWRVVPEWSVLRADPEPPAKADDRYFSRPGVWAVVDRVFGPRASGWGPKAAVFKRRAR